MHSETITFASGHSALTLHVTRRAAARTILAALRLPAPRALVLFSAEYLATRFAQPRLAAAIARDPTGTRGHSCLVRTRL